MTGAATEAELGGRTKEDARPTRVFVGLKLAPEITRELAELARSLEPYGVRLVPSADIHLTLVPPWNEPDIVNAVERLRATVNGFTAFPLTFARLAYGPTLRRPRLLWAECVASNVLVELRMALLTIFGQIDPRPFRPHVTLARFPTRGQVIARKAPIDQSLSLDQYVTSVELFQSPAKPQSGYQVVASVPLRPEANLESAWLA
jgi:2'-5' RNA ligase